MNRIKVQAGTVKVGDLIEGRRVRGLGKVWQEGQPRGELWQECEARGCRREPVCACCFYCQKHCTCGVVSVQYAYLEEPQ
ncbi:MAG: hypothetical protein N2047_04015 [Meiothermus sp.]|nr:hypothetical protein [Meiothermus sp.]GIW31425.1 MAG: hypothetical protein KatS3mg071_1599 [Meiothermus sp.]